MNAELKDSLYAIAAGQIDRPSLELEVDGEAQRFEGREAKIFAFGMLAGMKAAKEHINLENNIANDN